MDPTSNLPAGMSLHDDLDALRSDAPARIAEASDVEALAAVEAEAVGKLSPIAAGRAALRDLPDDDRREAGRAINEVAAELEVLIANRRAENGDRSIRLL